MLCLCVWIYIMNIIHVYTMIIVWMYHEYQRNLSMNNTRGSSYMRVAGKWVGAHTYVCIYDINIYTCVYTYVLWIWYTYILQIYYGYDTNTCINMKRDIEQVWSGAQLDAAEMRLLPTTHCNTLQHTATHCNTLQHTATHYNTLPNTANHFNTLRHTATHCNTLQHTATHCNTLQHTAVHCYPTHCNSKSAGAGFLGGSGCGVPLDVEDYYP